VFGLTSFVIIPLAMKLIPATLLAGLSWFVPTPGASTTDTLMGFLTTQKSNILAKISQGSLARFLQEAAVADPNSIINQVMPSAGTVNMNKLAEYVHSPDSNVANAFRRFLEDATHAQIDLKIVAEDFGAFIARHYNLLNNKAAFEQFLTGKGIRTAGIIDKLFPAKTGGSLDLVKLTELMNVSPGRDHAVADAIKEFVGNLTLSQMNMSEWKQEFISAIFQNQDFRSRVESLIGPGRTNEFIDFFKTRFEARVGNINVKERTVWDIVKNIVREYSLQHKIGRAGGFANDIEKQLLDAIWNTDAARDNLVQLAPKRLMTPNDPNALAHMVNYLTNYYGRYLKLNPGEFNALKQEVARIVQEKGVRQAEKVQKIMDVFSNLRLPKNRTNVFFSYLHAWTAQGKKTGYFVEVFFQSVRSVKDVSVEMVTVNPFKAVFRAGIAVVVDFWRGLGLWNQDKKQGTEGENKAPVEDKVVKTPDPDNTGAAAVEGLPPLALTMIQGINEAQTVENVTQIRDSAATLLGRDVADELLTQEAADAIMKAIDEAVEKRKAELPGTDEKLAAKVLAPRNWMKELDKLKANKEIKRIVNNMFTKNRNEQQILDAQKNALQILHGNKGPAIASRPAIEEVIRAATLAAIEQAKARQAAKAAALEAKKNAPAVSPATETGLNDVIIPENTPEAIQYLVQEMSESSRLEDLKPAYDLAIEALDGNEGGSLAEAEKAAIKDALRQIRAIREINEINDWLNDLLSYSPGSGRENNDVEQSKALIDSLIADSVLPDAQKEELLKRAETAYQNAVKPALSAEEKQVILQKSLLQEQARKTRAAIRQEIALVPQSSLQDIDAHVAAVTQKINDADLILAAKDLLMNELKQMADKQLNALYPLLGRLPEDQRQKVIELLKVDPQASLEQFEPAARIEEPVNEQGQKGPAAASPIADPDGTPVKKGGIDFASGIDKTLVIKPMGSFNGLNFALPVLSQDALNKMDLADEMIQIKNMAESGIVVSGARIKEFMAACMQKGEVNTYLNDLIVALVEICQWQEVNEPCDELPVEIKEALVLVDSKLST